MFYLGDDFSQDIQMNSSQQKQLAENVIAELPQYHVTHQINDEDIEFMNKYFDENVLDLNQEPDMFNAYEHGNMQPEDI